MDTLLNELEQAKNLFDSLIFLDYHNDVNAELIGKSCFVQLNLLIPTSLDDIDKVATAVHRYLESLSVSNDVDKNSVSLTRILRLLEEESSIIIGNFPSEYVREFREYIFEKCESSANVIAKQHYVTKNLIIWIC